MLSYGARSEKRLLEKLSPLSASATPSIDERKMVNDVLREGAISVKIGGGQACSPQLGGSWEYVFAAEVCKSYSNTTGHRCYFSIDISHAQILRGNYIAILYSTRCHVNRQNVGSTQ